MSGEGMGLSAAAAGLIAGIAGATLQVGGTIGAAAISADAGKYAIRQQTKADIQIALAEQQTQIKSFEAQLAAARVSEENQTLRTTERAGATKDILVQVAPYAALGVLGIAAMVVASRLLQPAQYYYAPPPPAGGQRRPSTKPSSKES